MLCGGSKVPLLLLLLLLQRKLPPNNNVTVSQCHSAAALTLSKCSTVSRLRPSPVVGRTQTIGQSERQIRVSTGEEPWFRAGTQEGEEKKDTIF